MDGQEGEGLLVLACPLNTAYVGIGKGEPSNKSALRVLKADDKKTLPLCRGSVKPEDAISGDVIYISIGNIERTLYMSSVFLPTI